MKYLSVCSGIEAASVAFKDLGWEPVAFSEIDKFPSSLLDFRFPKIRNMGDMTGYMGWGDDVFSSADIIVGGPPCQSFSSAGKRLGLTDSRGELTLTYTRIIDHADRIRLRHGKEPSIVIYENVLGLLSSKDNAFGCFLGALAGEECELEPTGKKWPNAGCVHGPKRAIAWRVLDAQYFGLAQRRKRVFLVASARDGFDPAKILFEFEGVRRDIAPSREAGQDAAAASQAGAGVTCFRKLTFESYARDETDSTMMARDYKSYTDLVVVHGTQDPIIGNNLAHALGRNGGQENTVFVGAFAQNSRDEVRFVGGDGEVVGALSTTHGSKQANLLAFSTHTQSGELPFYSRVRRLTPVECERLQGFPDNWTKIPWRNKPAEDCPDGHRYKALGNSMAVPVMRWIGERIISNL